MRKTSVLIRCDGDASTGLGHVVRCLAVADELRTFEGCTAVFAVRRGPLGATIIREHGYEVFEPARSAGFFDYERWLGAVARQVGARALVLDVRDELEVDQIRHLRANGLRIAVIDDPGDRRLAADIAFYPPVPQVRRMDWAGFEGCLLVGWDWVILRREFAHATSRAMAEHRPPKVLITMGGTDPAKLTISTLKALDPADFPMEPTVILGAGFSDDPGIESFLAQALRAYTVRRNVTDLWRVMAESDLAVASFGMTAYELAATGVPAVYLCLADDHAESASAFETAGLGLSLGRYDRLGPSQICSAIRRLLDDADLLSGMSQSGPRLVDGRGAKRVAEKVLSIA